MAFNADDYVPVAERLIAFYEKHPDGSIQTDIIELSDKRVVMRASVYRTSDDERPSIAHSGLTIPGKTNFTRDSEIENAETSAIGRAIAMLGFEVKRGVASREEVQGKQDEGRSGIGHKPVDPLPEADPGTDGLIGTVEVGKPPVDLELRPTPDGPAFGFKLKNGRKAYQVLAIGPLADALSLAGLKPDERVIVWGRMDMVPWDKDGKPMPPYPRIALSKVASADWILPAEEAVSLPMFDEAEQAAILAQEMADAEKDARLGAAKDRAGYVE